MHVGGGFNYPPITSNGPNVGIYEARVVIEFFVSDPAGGGVTAAGTPFYADTGQIRANQFCLFNLELAGQWGRFHFQSEYMGSKVDQNGGKTRYNDGACFQIDYYLTDEHRKYDKTDGVFNSVAPLTDFFSLGRNRGCCGSEHERSQAESAT